MGDEIEPRDGLEFEVLAVKNGWVLQLDGDQDETYVFSRMYEVSQKLQELLKEN